MSHPVPRVLLIDNHDSFTFNIAHLVAQACGALPTVVLADALDVPDLSEFTHLIIGPGPGTPHNPDDLGCSMRVYREALAAGIPVLGVCLGAQLMAVAHGGIVSRAKTPMHGLEDTVSFNPTSTCDPVFSHLPKRLRVVRYHSLAITECPEELEVLGVSSDGVPQAVRLRDRAAWGVQFHPESIRSESGLDLMRAFLAIRPDSVAYSPLYSASSVSVPAAPFHAATEHCTLEPTHTVLLGPETPLSDPCEQAEALFRQLIAPLPRAVWLDSASEDHRSRFSIMGAQSGPGASLLEYRVPADHSSRAKHPGMPVSNGFFDLLRERLAHVTLDPAGLAAAEQLGGFALGYVGYLGYGLAAETLGIEPESGDIEPDAHLVFLTRALVLDHAKSTIRPVALVDLADAAHAREQALWLDEQVTGIHGVLGSVGTRTPLASAKLSACGARFDGAFTGGASTGSTLTGGASTGSTLSGSALATSTPTLRHSHEHYRALIGECHRLIDQGESYELCLTNQVTVPGEPDGLEIYSRLRHIARVPYGAYLNCGRWQIASASPERFLEVSASGEVESRPIKGTAPRDKNPDVDAHLRHTLATSEKDRAENLMIVDLVRHDLSSVCEAGSVHVPRIYAIESFPTVHQMISTIRGTLAPGRTAIDAIEAAFPGGSMTGAPKLRTVQLLRELEAGPRGAYSGAIGWLSPNGAASLNIVIRTAIVSETETRFGVGGAITRLSTPHAEIAETVTKSRTLLAALGENDQFASSVPPPLITMNPTNTSINQAQFPL